ncbi:hypothetical protein IJ096_02275, partial [Candidatus Saccharibacteria bacterium]|nr:hypothetical protein [Candidatus Saccharibacteria bacterium]
MFKIILIMLTLMVGGGTLGVVARPVMAEGVESFASGVCEDSNIDEDLRKQAGCEEKREISSVAVTLINIVIGLIGLLAVVVIVIGGVQYATSLGQPNKISQARSIIIYGIIGLVVAALAWVIASAIINSIQGTGVSG